MAAARAALIGTPSATAPAMGTAVNQRVAMVVASPSFVVALANNVATIPKMGASLSSFGATFFLLGPDSELGLYKLDRGEICDGRHDLVE
jgi:hypothetical protein